MPDRIPTPLQAEKHLLGRWLAHARRRGLLAAVPPEAWHTLSCILSFTCRDGARRFTLDQLALALAIPRAEAERRLHDLARTQWQGQPVATPLRDPAGEVTGAEPAPTDLLLEPGESVPSSDGADSEPRGPEQFPLPLTGITNGSDALREDLAAAGLLPDQAERLLAEFAAERIRRQLAWLPQRGARNPAAFLIKAVANDWDPPKSAAQALREDR